MWLWTKITNKPVDLNWPDPDPVADQLWSYITVLEKKRAIPAPKSVLGIWENGCHSHTDDAFMLMPHHQFPWSGKTYWKATRTRTRRSRKTRFFFKTQLEQQQQQESDRCEGWSWISGVGGSALWSPFQCPQPWQGTWLQNHCGPCSLHDQPFPCPHHWWSHRFPPHPFLSFFLNISYMLWGVNGFHVLSFWYWVLRCKESWVSFCSYCCVAKNLRYIYTHTTY